MILVEMTEAMVGWLYLLSGFSLLLQTKLWITFSGEFKQNPVHNIAFMMILFLLGLYVIQTHNIWAWEIPVIVTVLGWAMALESALYLLYPAAVFKLFPPKNKLSCILKAKGVILLILSVVVLYSVYCV